ncbi:MAG: hypothetical protein ACK5BL_08560, partial [Flavobacteriales bacterium]
TDAVAWTNEKAYPGKQFPGPEMNSKIAYSNHGKIGRKSTTLFSDFPGQSSNKNASPKSKRRFNALSIS